MFPDLLRKSGAYIERDHEGTGMLNQFEPEIAWAVERCASILPREHFLEVGFGCGGSFLVWTQLFTNVGAVNFDSNRVKAFREKYPQYTDCFHLGSSQDPAVVESVRHRFPRLDGLYLDAGHSYAEVKADYNNFAPLVRPGGIIIFHDTFHGYPDAPCGVPVFIRELISAGHEIDVYSSTIPSRSLDVLPVTGGHYGMGIEIQK